MDKPLTSKEIIFYSGDSYEELNNQGLINSDKMLYLQVPSTYLNNECMDRFAIVLD